LLLSYRPPIGLAAARIDIRAGREHITPDFATVMLCCSIDSNNAWNNTYKSNLNTYMKLYK